MMPPFFLKKKNSIQDPGIAGVLGYACLQHHGGNHQQQGEAYGSHGRGHDTFRTATGDFLDLENGDAYGGQELIIKNRIVTVAG